MRPGPRSNRDATPPDDLTPSSDEFVEVTRDRSFDPDSKETLLRRACGDDVELRREAERILALKPGDPLGETLIARAASLSLAAANLVLLEDARETVAANPGRPGPARTIEQPATIAAEVLEGDALGPTLALTRQPSARTWAFPGGRTLGRFELIRPVGSGGFGTVYEARDPKLDRTVAVKVLHIGEFATGDQADRFLREARNAAQLRHPAIVQVHEFGEHNRLPFIVSDFIDGMPLSDWLESEKPTPLESARLVAVLAEALDYAHKQGVIHRDVKPSNIMIDSLGRPHIMDFGLAKRDSGEVTMTRQGDILGTPAYMSPEQARGESHEVDGRSDVYSLGVVLYVLLTGELPFHGKLRILIHQVLNEEPRSPRSLVETIPRDLETICLKAMTKEPHQRYASAGEMAEDLRRFERAEPIKARPSGFVERAWKWCKRNPKLAWAFAAVAGAMLLTIASLAAATLNFRASNLREAEARAKAQSGLQLACDAVDSLLTRVGDDPTLVARGHGLSELAFSARSWIGDDLRPSAAGMDQLRKDLLLRAREFYEKILKEAGDDPRLEADHARTCLRLAKIFIWLQDFPEAITQSAKARSILVDLPRAERDLPENRELLGRSFALSGLARWWRYEWGEALMELKAAASVYAKLTRDYPDTIEYRTLECSILNLQGRQACRFQGREAEGVEALERCLGLCEPMAARHPDNPEFSYEKARALITLSEFDEGRGKYEGAKEKRVDAMRLLGGLVERFPKVTDYKVLYAQLYSSLINLETNFGHPERALAVFNEMRPVVERMTSQFAQVSAFRECLAIGDAGFAIAEAKLGHHAEAEAWADKALARSPASGIVMFVSACSFSLASGSVKADAELDPASRLEHRARYQARANQLLVRAKEVGLFKDPIYVRQMTEYSDFDPMKGDPAFDRFLDELLRAQGARPDPGVAPIDGRSSGPR